MQYNTILFLYQSFWFTYMFFSNLLLPFDFFSFFYVAQFLEFLFFLLPHHRTTFVHINTNIPTCLMSSVFLFLFCVILSIFYFLFCNAPTKISPKFSLSFLPHKYFNRIKSPQIVNRFYKSKRRFNILRRQRLKLKLFKIRMPSKTKSLKQFYFGRHL